MKKTSKIITIIASIMLGIGIILSVIGLSLGGATSTYVDRTGIHFDNDSRYQKTINFKEISDININVDFSKVEIVKADYNRVEIDVSKRYEPDVKVKDGKLSIKNNGAKLKFSINLFNFKSPKSKITIYLKDPEKLNTVVLVQSFGEIKATSLTAKKLDLETHFGDIKVEGTFEEIDSQTNFGDIKIDTNKTKQLNVETNFGDTKVTIDDNRGNYQIDRNSQFGDIEIDGDSIKNESFYYNKIDLKTNFGDIKLKFLK